MRSSIIKLYFFVSITSLLLISCSRSDETTTKLSFLMPPAQIAHRQAAGVNGLALTSNDLLQRVMINITGTGISIPIFQAWDSGGSSSAPAALPGSFNLVVPSGNGRLVQVLSVYKNSVTQNMSFYYGDVTADLLSASMSLSVPISLISTGAMVSGQVSGRYIDSSTGTAPNNIEAGPTGIVEMSYTPVGHPPMIVDRNFIINGWFSFFMLSGVSLSYTVQPAGIVLWGGPVSLDSAQFASNASPITPSPSAVLRNYMPVHYTNYSGGTPQGNEAEISVWGYWGAGVNSATNPKYICSDLAPSMAYTNMFSMSPSASGTLTPLMTSNIGLAPTNAQLIDSTTLALSSVYYSGGQTGTQGLCAGSSSNFKQYQFVAKAQLDGNGKDSASGMNGFLARQITVGVSGAPSYASTVTTSISASTNTLNLVGQILPDIAGVSLDSIRVFKIKGNQDFHSNVNCFDLATGALGALSSGSVAVTASASGGLTPFTVSTNITPTEANSGVNVALCPVKAGSLLPMAALVNYHELGYDMYPTVLNATIGASTPLASFVGVATTNTLPTPSVSGCVTMNVNLLGMSGMQKPSGMAGTRMPVVTATTSSASNSVMFYPNMSCTPTGIQNVLSTSFVATASMYQLSFVASGPASANYTITINDDASAPIKMAPVSFSFTK